MNHLIPKIRTFFMNNSFSSAIHGKTILITGGTGSFGNSVVPKLLSYNPKRIIIFSRDEKKQFDMRNKYNNPILRFTIGDVRDKESIGPAIEGVDYVFHAAALKQVPSCEFFPMEAVKTNIIGINNVIDVSIEHKVKRLVFLSTDKAVYPINAMGMTKALMEKIMIAASKRNADAKKTDTILCAVRYGNVLYSRGSILSHFVELMRKNEILTVTNPDMTRFLLPLSHAVDLVLFALISGENGDIYVRKAPAATIATLTKALCKIFDYKKGYKEVGLRAGEKMHETLISSEEFTRKIDMGDYYKIPPESHGLDYSTYFFTGKKIEKKDIGQYTSQNTKRLDVESTRKLLLSLEEIRLSLEEYKKGINAKSESTYTILG